MDTSQTTRTPIIVSNSKPETRRKDIIFLSLVLLIIFTLPISNFFITTDSAALWMRYVYAIIFYIFVAFLVWLEVKNLADFHIDHISLLIIALFGSIFHRRLGVPGEIYFQIILWLCSISIISALIIERSNIPKTNIKWAANGIIIAIITSFLLAKFQSYLPEISSHYSQFEPINSYSIIVLNLLRNYVYQFSYVAPYEELLFRGLLWGYLIRLGFREERVIWFQAILFWILHANSLLTPINFFFVLPTVTLLVTVLVRYSKQLLPSIILHSTVNATMLIILTSIVNGDSASF